VRIKNIRRIENIRSRKKMTKTEGSGLFLYAIILCQGDRDFDVEIPDDV